MVSKMDWDLIYEDLKKKNWIILLFFSSISYFSLTPSHTLGILTGGIVSIMNFRYMQHTLKNFFGRDFKCNSRKISVFLHYYFRIFVLGISIFFLLKYQLVNPIGLVLGLSTVVVSIIITGISEAFKTNGGEV